MWIPCSVCKLEINLDHVIFQNYKGPVKCFSCGEMMEVRTIGGVVEEMTPLGEKAVYGKTAVPVGNPNAERDGDLRWKSTFVRKEAGV